MESLRRYLPRSAYMQKALFKLFNLSQGTEEPREDIIKVLTLVEVIINYYYTTFIFPVIFSSRPLILECAVNVDCHFLVDLIRILFLFFF